jgi:hypothetical protein
MLSKVDSKTGVREKRFNKELFNSCLQSVNECIKQWYKAWTKDDRKDFKKCCSSEEKKLLKKCILIAINNLNDTFMHSDIYTAIIEYYYASIVLEYYVQNEFNCFNHERGSKITQLKNMITTGDDEWESEIRRIINFSILGGKGKKSRRRSRRNKRKSRKHRKSRKYRKSRKH